MKKVLPLITLGLSVCFLSLQVQAAGCFGHPNMYRLLCRGPMGLMTSGSTPESGLAETRLFFKFKPNSKKAGAEGADLTAGTCAWTDRATNPTGEPTTILFDMKRNDFLRLNGDVARSCLSDKTCVVEFCATNENDPFLNRRVLKSAGHMMIETYYPRFSVIVPPIGIVD